MAASDTHLIMDGVLSPSAEISIGNPAVDRFLGALRRHLDMDVAFVSEFRIQDRILHHVDAKSRKPIVAGDVIPLGDGYCQHVVSGRLPELMPDTTLVPLAMQLPATAAIPIGAHLSVPIRLSDGSCYGTFCCFSFRPDRTLGPRDIDMMRVFADMLAEQIDRDANQAKIGESRRLRIRTMLEQGQPSVVYQPIVDLKTSLVVGFECLSRFHVEPTRAPNEWFLEASQAGLGSEVEIAAIRTALQGLQHLPSSSYLAINCSPDLIASGALFDVLSGVELSRVVVELTEHVHIDDYSQLLARLAELRSLGLRVAIDDAGAGYASMRHILMIRPDFIKLDISLTQHIDTDPMRRALAAALIAFARETNAKIVAEGVETAAELNALKRLGISKAQGYYLGRPTPLHEALSVATQTRAALALAPVIHSDQDTASCISR